MNREKRFVLEDADYVKWGNEDMQLPEIVKQIGKTDEKEHIYIEDYVYTYLHELGRRTKESPTDPAGGGAFPLRVALYGHAGRREGRRFYLIYGAAGVVEELERGRSEEQVRKEYFEEYELIGYVNIFGGRQRMPGKKEGYFIFYEKNEPMQNYLLACYERKKRRPAAGAAGANRLGNTIRKFFYGGCIIVLALSVTAINDYDKMYGFVKTADRAISFMEREPLRPR